MKAPLVCTIAVAAITSSLWAVGNTLSLINQISYGTQNDASLSRTTASASTACMDDFEIFGLAGVGGLGGGMTIGRVEAAMRNTGEDIPTGWRVNIYSSPTAAAASDVGDVYSEEFDAPSAVLPGFHSGYDGFDLLRFSLGCGTSSSGSRTLEPDTYWVAVIALDADYEVALNGDGDDSAVSAVSSPGSSTTPLESNAAYIVSTGSCCWADFNQDLVLDEDDYDDYVDCFFATPPCSEVDFNGDGVRTPDDLADFITAYFIGC